MPVALRVILVHRQHGIWFPMKKVSLWQSETPWPSLYSWNVVRHRLLNDLFLLHVSSLLVVKLKLITVPECQRSMLPLVMHWCVDVSVAMIPLDASIIISTLPVLRPKHPGRMWSLSWLLRGENMSLESSAMINHYSDVIMGATVSQITSLTQYCLLNRGSNADQRKNHCLPWGSI